MWPCLKKGEARKKGTAKGVAVPEIGGSEKKGNGEGSGRARNREKRGKGEWRRGWPFPK
ncbi:hypothetical protein J14TS2_53920 [Bacillus sp. J14TS2]|nr:hypothetical protein J14TS2_53920 [Bacillus sp. J14TS2]